MNRLKKAILKGLLKLPVSKSYSYFIYKQLGVKMDYSSRLSIHAKILGSYSNLSIAKNAEINNNCFFLAKDKIVIGENAAIAYNVTIITSANPNSPHNKLCKLYPAMTAPVIIDSDVWIGANSLILPGVKIGSYSIVAAGSVVNHDVPSGVVVAGVPAKIIKYLSPDHEK